MVAIKCMLAANETLLQETRHFVAANDTVAIDYFIFEVLRLYPPADMPGYLDQDGVPVLRDIYAYHRNAAIFVNPLVFDPERFRERPEELAKLAAFNDQHPARSCPGKIVSIIAFRRYVRKIVGYKISCNCVWHGVSLQYYWHMPTNGSCTFVPTSMALQWQTPVMTVTVVLSVLGCVFLMFGGIYVRHQVLVRTIDAPPAQSATDKNATVPLLPEVDRLTVAVDNLHYTTPSGAHILRGVTTMIKPGELVAVMGSSGSGKTTLMDVLSGRRRSGTVEGHLYVNGKDVRIEQGRHSKSFTAITQSVGYMLQLVNSFSDTLTVRQNLIYAALIRLPASMSFADKVERADRILNELGLSEKANVRIGGDVGGGISGGQKRKLQLGIEMLSLPPVLILDEPTSGLDTRSALMVTTSLH
eukprot:6388043-Prymnesium_polylepis.1